MTPVTRAEVISANHAIQHLAPAISSLEKVDPQALGYDKQAVSKTAEFLKFLRGKLDESQAVIVQAEKQHAERDQDLILACLTRITSIESETKVAIAKAKSLRCVFESKILELKKQNFTDDEICKIIPDPAAEIAELNAERDSLEKETLAIQKFLDSAPAYDQPLGATKVGDVLALRNALGQKATRT